MITIDTQRLKSGKDNFYKCHLWDGNRVVTYDPYNPYLLNLKSR